MAKQVQHPEGALLETRVDPARGPFIGELLGFSERGYPLIELTSHDDPIEAPTTFALDRDDVGCTVLVVFVRGDRDQPVVTGRLLAPLPLEERPRPEAEVKLEGGALKIESEGERVIIEAQEELVLRCGKASLRLRRDGRVEVRGVDIVSRASRANWIKGGSVALN